MTYFYVICPVGADPDFSLKRSLLARFGDEHGLQPFFPLERHGEFSLEATRREMQGAEFVLADLSLERPSCYFELGLARAENAHIFLIAAAGTPIHQVGDGSKIIFYSDLTEYRAAVSQILAHQTELLSRR